jgi:hypothetical protein
MMGDGVQGARAHGRDADMRREAAIRIDFVRRKREHRALNCGRRKPFERGKKKRDVGAGLFELAVAGHDEQHDTVRLGMSRRRHQQRLGRRCQSGDRARGRIHAAASDGGLQRGAEVQRG